MQCDLLYWVILDFAKDAEIYEVDERNVGKLNHT